METASQEALYAAKRQAAILLGDRPSGRHFQAEKDIAGAILARTGLEKTLQDSGLGRICGRF